MANPSLIEEKQKYFRDPYEWRLFLTKLAPNLRIEEVTLLADLSKNNWSDTQYYSRFLKPVNSLFKSFCITLFSP